MSGEDRGNTTWWHWIAAALLAAAVGLAGYWLVTRFFLGRKIQSQAVVAQTRVTTSTWTTSEGFPAGFGVEEGVPFREWEAKPLTFESDEAQREVLASIKGKTRDQARATLGDSVSCVRAGGPDSGGDDPTDPVNWFATITEDLLNGRWPGNCEVTCEVAKPRKGTLALEIRDGKVAEATFQPEEDATTRPPTGRATRP